LDIRTNGRIKEIDGIRGVAILLVVSFHYLNNQLLESTGTIGKALCKATGFGWVGVDLFFVLSGFLIGRIILRNISSPNLIKTFFIRRALKIIPNYYLLLLVFLLINALAYFKGNYFLTGLYNIPAWSYFTMLHNFFMAKTQSLGNDSLSITWSIAIEEQFYLVIPFILIWQKRHINKILIALVGIGIISRACFDHWIPRYVLLNCRMDSLAIGIMVSRIELNEAYKAFVIRQRKVTQYILAALLAVIAIVFYLYGDLGIWKHTIFALVFALVMIMVLFQDVKPLKFVLSNSILAKIGEVSYSLYLFHYMILGVVHHVFGRQSLGLLTLSDAIATVVAFFVSIGLSFFIYNQYENRFNLLGKKYKYR